MLLVIYHYSHYHLAVVVYTHNEQHSPADIDVSCIHVYIALL